MTDKEKAIEKLEKAREHIVIFNYHTAVTFINQALALLREQPKAGEFTKEVELYLQLNIEAMRGNLEGVEKPKLSKFIDDLLDYLCRACELLGQTRWIPADEPPAIFAEAPIPKEEWETHYWTLEYEAKIPKVMSAGQIWLDEGSEVEYYKPIVLPKQAEKGKND